MLAWAICAHPSRFIFEFSFLRPDVDITSFSTFLQCCALKLSIRLLFSIAPVTLLEHLSLFSEYPSITVLFKAKQQ